MNSKKSLPLYDDTVCSLVSGFDIETGKPKKKTKWKCLEDFIASLREACKDEGDRFDAQTMRAIHLVDEHLGDTWCKNGTVNWKFVKGKQEADRKMWDEFSKEDKDPTPVKTESEVRFIDGDRILRGEFKMKRVWSDIDKRWFLKLEGKTNTITICYDSKGNLIPTLTTSK